jgi:hypothetical protein
MGPLSDADIASFVERGWCALRGAFDETRAAAVRAAVWHRMRAKAGIAEDDPASWPPGYDIEERLDIPAVFACFPDRLCDAIEQLLGPGRWRGERRWGFWPVNFHQGWDDPRPVPTEGWHIDGNWFRHTLDCPRQGLLVMGLFSDVEAGSGGTVVAEGSHIRTAQVLARAPADGLDHRALFEQVLAEPIGDFRELTGRAGDVVLAHPFLFHNRGFKRHGPPRIQSNVEAPLRAPLRLSHDSGDASVLERSIRRALELAPAAPAAAVRCRF